jgi:hypothetical protein
VTDLVVMLFKVAQKLLAQSKPRILGGFGIASNVTHQLFPLWL